MKSVPVYKAEALLDRRFILGEGPVWDEQRGKILWVDIRTGSLFIWDSKTRQLEEIQTGQNLGAIVPVESGGYLAAMTCGVYYLNDGGLSLLCRPAELKDNLRLNDAKCDPAGRFWFGTMGLFRNAPEGSLFCLNTDGTCRRMLAGVGTSNGLAWSADGTTMYYIDTAEQGVDAFDFSMSTGDIANRRRIITFEKHFPDGMTIDEEGKLWIALWGGSRLVRCDPSSGTIIGELPLPAENVTSCCFAGEELDTLIITSSGEGFDDPQAGRVFFAMPGVRGTPTWCYKGTEKRNSDIKI